MRNFTVYTNVVLNLRKLYANRAKRFIFSLGGGGGAEICIEVGLPNGQTLVFGDDTERWYGAAVDANGEEVTEGTEVLETDVVGTSQNAELIARGIMTCVDTYLCNTAS